MNKSLNKKVEPSVESKRESPKPTNAVTNKFSSFQNKTGIAWKKKKTEKVVTKLDEEKTQSMKNLVVPSTDSKKSQVVKERSKKESESIRSQKSTLSHSKKVEKTSSNLSSNKPVDKIPSASKVSDNLLGAPKGKETVAEAPEEMKNLFAKLKSPEVKNSNLASRRTTDKVVSNIQIPRKDNSKLFEQESAKIKKEKSEESPSKMLSKKTEETSQVHLSAQTNENTRMSDNFRPINIIWDRSILAKGLAKFNQDGKLKKINALISKVDNALKRYIHLKKDVDTLIEIPAGFAGCKTSRDQEFTEDKFKSKISVEGDLMIFLVAEKTNNDVLASASPCVVNSHRRTYVGRLYLNLHFLKLEYGSYYEQKMEIMTVFHEVLHILAFHPKIHSGLYDEVKSGALNDTYLNLNKMKQLPVNPLLNEGHWNPAYFGNDLMAPIERVDSALSIFTLEYLDLVSPEIKTDRSVLPNNFIFDEISDFNDFFTYKCSPFDKKAKYSAFCSPMEEQRGEFSCDRSRMYKSVCDDQRLSNGCYARESHQKYICSNPMMPASEHKVFETYGEKSRCFETVIKGTKQHALCLEFEVNDVGVLIKAEGAQYQCTKPGELLTMKTRKDGGKKAVDVRCPDPKEFKKVFDLTNCVQSCYGNGFCSNGRCHCFDGYDPSDHCKSKTKSLSSTRFTAAL